MMVTKCSSVGPVVFPNASIACADLVRDLHLHREARGTTRTSEKPNIHLCASTTGIIAAQPRAAAVGLDVARGGGYRGVTPTGTNGELTSAPNAPSLHGHPSRLTCALAVAVERAVPAVEPGAAVRRETHRSRRVALRPATSAAASTRLPSPRQQQREAAAVVGVGLPLDAARGRRGRRSPRSRSAGSPRAGGPAPTTRWSRRRAARAPGTAGARGRAARSPPRPAWPGGRRHAPRPVVVRELIVRPSHGESIEVSRGGASSTASYE